MWTSVLNNNANGFQISGCRRRNHPLGGKRRVRPDVLFSVDRILSCTSCALRWSRLVPPSPAPKNLSCKHQHWSFSLLQNQLFWLLQMQNKLEPWRFKIVKFLMKSFLLLVKVATMISNLFLIELHKMHGYKYFKLFQPLWRYFFPKCFLYTLV